MAITAPTILYSGHLVAEKGHTVVLSNHVIDHIVINERFVSSVKHQVRWMKSTRFSRPAGHLGTALTFSVPFGILAGATALALHCAGTRDLAIWLERSQPRGDGLGGGGCRRSRPPSLAAGLLYPLRDFLGCCYWVASYFNDKIVWRGEIYRLVKGRAQHNLATEASSDTDKHHPAVPA